MESNNDVWSQALSQYFPEKNWELHPVPGGLNNLTKYVKTPTETFVMRVYQNGYGIDKIHYEHKVLRQLESYNFSFQTPRIRPTLKGEDCAITADGNQAVMFYLIPGHALDESNMKHITEMGRVAGELIEGIKNLKIDMQCPTAPYYEFYKLHPSVPDEKTFLDAMASSVFDEYREYADFVLKEILELVKMIEPYKKSLPVQHIHGDLWIGNCLIENDKMSAVLDFEFIALDWKALEVAICVSRFPSQANPWGHFEAFLEGFKMTGTLKEEEIEAVPVMMKLRLLTNIIHFVGRYLGGFDSAKDLTDRICVYYKRLGWINENGGKIVELFKKAMLGK